MRFGAPIVCWLLPRLSTGGEPKATRRRLVAEACSGRHDRFGKCFMPIRNQNYNVSYPLYYLGVHQLIFHSG